MEATRTSRPDRVRFDKLCSDVDEWDPLLALLPYEEPQELKRELERERADEESTPLDEQILAGLVTPV